MSGGKRMVKNLSGRIEGDMSVVNPNKHWEVQSYGMIINKGEIMVNREKLETIVYVFEGKFYVELWDNGYLLHFQEMLGD
jgi:hypothetical protein